MPPIVLPIPATLTRANCPMARKVIFGIRPEAVTDRDGVDRGAKSVATFDARVEIGRAGGRGHVRGHLRRWQGAHCANAR